MRNEETVLAEIEAKGTEYRDGRATKSFMEMEALSTEINTLNKELAAVRAKGAKPCPKCGQPPIGMIRRPAHIDRGMPVPEVREVGCVHCWPELVEDAEGRDFHVGGKDFKAKRVSYSALGGTTKDAVEAWNAGKYIEDMHFSRCPMTYGETVIKPDARKA